MTTALTLVGGVLRRVAIRPYVAPPLVRTVDGLVYADDFADLSGWTSDGSWTATASPAMVTFGRLPYNILTGLGIAAEDDGVREPQLYVEGDVWWLLYDAGNGSTGWRQFLASSDDRGLTWTRHGQVIGLDDGTGGTYDATATGWLEKRGSTYYLHRVTALDTFGAPNVGLPGSPYGWDTWSASSPLGPWTFVNKTTPPAVSWVTTEFLPCCVYKDGSTYYAIVQGAGTNYSLGYATSSSPTGPWTTHATAQFDKSQFNNRIPENGKVFYHPGLGRYVMLMNLIASAGTHTDRNAVALSTSLTDWSGASRVLTQSIGGADTTGNAVGVAAHVTGPDGELVYDVTTGHVPLVYDASPLSASPGWHLGRTIHGGILEPSDTTAVFNNPAATNLNLVRSLSHTDFEAEFVVRFNNTTNNTNVGLWFRMDDTLANGYRLVVRNTDQLLLQKVTGGVVSTKVDATVGLTAGAAPGSLNRIRVRVVGTAIKAWLDGQLQIDTTDTAHTSGTKVALSGFAANADVRKFSFRTGTTITVDGVTDGDTVVLRSFGGLPVAAVTATGGEAVFTDVTHGPHRSIQVVGGSEYVPDDGIWPGDTYTLGA
jgi:hypothetical protein